MQDGNFIRMIRAILNKPWKQHPTKQKLYSQIPPIPKKIQIRRTRYAGNSWKSKNELISDILQWTLSHRCSSVGRPTRTYVQPLRADPRYYLEDLKKFMIETNSERERVKEIRST